MALCPTLNVANAPPSDASLHIIGYTAQIEVNGAVMLARAPVEQACVSSGFGARNSQTHTGIDYYNLEPVSIYAAGDGIVREAVTRADFGNMLVIDHGHGVFTRYAHLDNFDGMEVGGAVVSGQVIGVMGNSASHDNSAPSSLRNPDRRLGRSRWLLRFDADRSAGIYGAKLEYFPF